MTKTRAAFTLSARQLCEKYPRLYFWTVTFCTLKSDWEASARFSAFLNHLREVVGRTGWGGLRVVELHKEHGVHYHLLVTERLAVDLVRKVGRCHGIGRVQVGRVWEHEYEEAINYLAKYLSKQKEAPRTEGRFEIVAVKDGPFVEWGIKIVKPRAMRRWAAFGDIPRTKVSDMVNDSPMWVYRRENKLGWLNSFADEHVLNRCWDHGPEHFRAAWFACRRSRGHEDSRDIAIGKLVVGPLGVMSESVSRAKQSWEKLQHEPF